MSPRILVNRTIHDALDQLPEMCMGNSAKTDVLSVKVAHGFPWCNSLQSRRFLGGDHPDIRKY